MTVSKSVTPKALMEEAIRKTISERPQWFGQKVYVVAHKTIVGLWVLKIYEKGQKYKPDEVYSETDVPPNYWWWQVDCTRSDKPEVGCMMEDVRVNPMYIALTNVGDVLIDSDGSLQFYDIIRD